MFCFQLLTCGFNVAVLAVMWLVVLNHYESCYKNSKKMTVRSVIIYLNVISLQTRFFSEDLKNFLGLDVESYRFLVSVIGNDKNSNVFMKEKYVSSLSCLRNSPNRVRFALRMCTNQIQLDLNLNSLLLLGQHQTRTFCCDKAEKNRPKILSFHCWNIPLELSNIGRCFLFRLSKVV